MEIGDRVAQIGLTSLTMAPETCYLYYIFGRLGHLIEKQGDSVIVDFNGHLQKLPARIVVKYDSPEFKIIDKRINNLHKYKLMTFVLTKHDTPGYVHALHPEVKVALVDFGKEKLWVGEDELRVKVEKTDPNHAFLSYKRSTSGWR